MFETIERKIDCPYCGETIDVIVDCSVPEQRYIEDCQVCCRPIEIHAEVDTDSELSITVSSEND